MHDIDRTQGEVWGELGEYEQHAGSLETFEFHESGELGEAEGESPFNEVQEMELASELLEINSEAELDQFLGKLIKGATKAVGSFVRSPIGKALGGALKGVAKTALPIAGRALGTMVGGPLGGVVGGKLGSFASSLFEMELEGLSQEDREFEVAKQFVRMAGTAAQVAARAPTSADPRLAAQRALAAAAQAHGATNVTTATTPSAGAMAPNRMRRGGRWVRRGRSIVLFGA
jgi:hypothetical protein